MVRNVGESVVARLRNKARAERVDVQHLLTRYVLERLLYRLGNSRYKDAFVLKGAMLFVAWSGNPHRHTADADFHGLSDAGGAEAVEAMMREVLSDPSAVDDGVAFDTSALKLFPIREGFIPGMRVIGQARVHTAVVKLKVDVGFGDSMTPGAVKDSFPTILDMPAPHILMYPRESVVAEKLHCIVDKGLENTRLKDFFDLWTLAETFSFDGEILSEAVRSTFATRGTVLPDGVPAGLSEAYVELNTAAWTRYLARDARMPKLPAFGELVDGIRVFVMPAVELARGESVPAVVWTPGRGWGEAPEASTEAPLPAP